MNIVTLTGRLTRDPEIRTTNSEIAVCRMNIAVDRRYKKEGEQSADFIGCIAFGKTAEFIDKYFTKGKRIGLQGRLNTSSWKDGEGNTRYGMDVLVEQVEFLESKGDGGKDTESKVEVKKKKEKHVPVKEIEDDELPF